MNKTLLLTLLFVLHGCSFSNENFWGTPVGSSVFSGWFSGAEEEKPKPKPIITYQALQQNIGSDLTANYSYPLHSIPVGKKITDSLVGSLPTVKLGTPISGEAQNIYNNVVNAFPPDVSGLIPEEGDPVDSPGEQRLPFSDLNRDPMITHPFTPLEAIPKAPPTEFFFDEIRQKPPFLE